VPVAVRVTPVFDEISTKPYEVTDSDPPKKTNWVILPVNTPELPVMANAEDPITWTTAVV